MQPARSRNELGSPRQKGGSPPPSKVAGIEMLQSMLRAQVVNIPGLAISKSREQMLQPQLHKFFEVGTRDGKPISLHPTHKCYRLTVINLFHGVLLLASTPSLGWNKPFLQDLLQCLLGRGKVGDTIEEYKHQAAQCLNYPEQIDKLSEAFLGRLYKEESIRVDTGGSQNAHEASRTGSSEANTEHEQLSQQQGVTQSQTQRWAIIKQFAEVHEGQGTSLDYLIRFVSDILFRSKLPCKFAFIGLHNKKNNIKATGLEAFNRNFLGATAAKILLDTEVLPKISVTLIEKNKKEFHLRFSLVKSRELNTNHGSSSKVQTHNDSTNNSGKKQDPHSLDGLGIKKHAFIVIDEQPILTAPTNSNNNSLGMIRQKSAKEYDPDSRTEAKRIVSSLMQKLKPIEESANAESSPKSTPLLVKISVMDLSREKHYDLSASSKHQNSPLPLVFNSIDRSEASKEDLITKTLKSSINKQEKGISDDNTEPKAFNLVLQNLKPSSGGKLDLGPKTSGRTVESSHLIPNLQIPLHSLYSNHQRRQDLTTPSGPKHRTVGKSLDEPKVYTNLSASQRISKMIPTLDVTQLRHSLETIAKGNFRANLVTNLSDQRTKLSSMRIVEKDFKASELMTVSNKNSARSPKNAKILVNSSAAHQNIQRKTSEVVATGEQEGVGVLDKPNQLPDYRLRILEELKNEGVDPMALQSVSHIKPSGISRYLKKEVNHQRKKSKPEPQISSLIAASIGIPLKSCFTAREKPTSNSLSMTQHQIVSQTSNLLSGIAESKPNKQMVEVSPPKPFPSQTESLNLYLREELAHFDTADMFVTDSHEGSFIMKNESFEAIKLEDLNPPVNSDLTRMESPRLQQKEASTGIKGIKSKFKSLLIKPDQNHLDKIFPAPLRANQTPKNSGEPMHILSSGQKQASVLCDTSEADASITLKSARKASDQFGADSGNQSKLQSSGASWKVGLIPKQQNEHFIKNLKNPSPVHEQDAQKLDNSIRRYAKKANSKDNIVLENRRDSLGSALDPGFGQKKPSLNNIYSKPKVSNQVLQQAVETNQLKDSQGPAPQLVCMSIPHIQIPGNCHSNSAPLTPKASPAVSHIEFTSGTQQLPWLVTNKPSEPFLGILAQPVLFSGIQQGQIMSFPRATSEAHTIAYVPMSQIFLSAAKDGSILLNCHPNLNQVFDQHTTQQMAIPTGSSPLPKPNMIQSPPCPDLSSAPLTPLSAPAPLTNETHTPVEASPVTPKQPHLLPSLELSPNEHENLKQGRYRPSPGLSTQPDPNTPPTPQEVNNISQKAWTAKQRLLVSISTMTSLMQEHSARIRSSLLPERSLDYLSVSPQPHSPNYRYQHVVHTAPHIPMPDPRLSRPPVSRIDDFNARSISRHPQTDNNRLLGSVGPMGDVFQPQYLLSHTRSQKDLYHPLELPNEDVVSDFRIYQPSKLTPMQDTNPVPTSYYSIRQGLTAEQQPSHVDRPRNQGIQIRSVSTSVGKFAHPVAVQRDLTPQTIYHKPAEGVTHVTTMYSQPSVTGDTASSRVPLSRYSPVSQLK